MPAKSTHFSFRQENKIMLIANELQPVLMHFPEARNKIIQLFYNDLNFRSMCEDYWMCTKMLEKFAAREGQYELLETEYQSIRMLLEIEVNDYLLRK